MKTLKELLIALTEINENTQISLDRIENDERAIMNQWVYNSLVH